MIIQKITLIFLSLFTLNASALNESTVVIEIKDAVLNDKTCSGKDEKFWKIIKVKTKVHIEYWEKSNYSLTVSKFGCDNGTNGSLVVSPGRTESSIEFYETAIDFINKGFSPIYVVDHVGQGFSPRLLSDQKKGHINRFGDYIDAFDSAVGAVQRDLKTNKKTKDQKPQALYFLSNSMGGAIGIGYFQKKGKANPFKAAALLGPMIRINYLGFPTGDENQPNGITHPTKRQSLLYTEAGVIAQAHYFCKTKGCESYATKIAQETAAEHGSAYLEGLRDFDKASDLAPEQVMTHSRSRYDLKTFLWESPETKALYEKLGLNNPQLSAPSYQWVKRAAKFNVHMRTKRNVQRLSNMPIKIMTGEKDVRAYTPSADGSTDLSTHIKFCKRINRVKSSRICDFVQVDGAYHELLKENQDYRQPTIDAVIEHFKRN